MSSFNDTQASRSSMGSYDRKLRYRALLEDLSTVDDENGNNSELMNKIANVVQEAQTLLAEGGVEERVKHPGEGYLDSRVLRSASDLAVRCSEAVSGNVNTYDKHDLALHIRENPDFWCFPFPREVPPVGFLFGTFAPTPPELRPRAPRRQVQRQEAQALKAPENVNRLEKIEEGSQMVSRVNRFITKTYKTSGKPLSYFHTVLNPHSFSATIENIYYVSFLVRDAKLSMKIDNDSGLPFITPVPEAQQEQRDISDENQFIVSMDMQRWQDLVNAFGITDPMMTFKR
ncbi:SMC5-SMC6 complex kleisin component Non-SMC element 1 [Anticarsia gemmatalis]|uniref:SMC5-SMC6 complex kleisin component Non-SMC element 1 n=1 Tax=Anticarsia gemmatalis TaxID=129554 RepID=UPI003F759A32